MIDDPIPQQQKLITSIETNAREFFPNGECKVHHDEADGCWVLLVNHDDLTNPISSGS